MFKSELEQCMRAVDVQLNADIRAMVVDRARMNEQLFSNLFADTIGL